MWPDDYYYQRQLFYNYRWTKEMEQTFVDALLDHATHGQFRVGRENRHAVHCSLRAVNKAHNTKVTALWAFGRVKRLHERFEVFNWLIHRADVVWNQNLKFVTAADSVWEEICREKKMARCYINAYEELFEDLCVLFGQPVDNEQGVMVVAPAPLAAIAPPVVNEDAAVVVVDPEPVHVHGPIVVAPLINIISDSSDSSEDFWKTIEAHYVSDSEDDSILALPGVPSCGPKESDSAYNSPGGHSNGGESSSASNATPLKKKL